MPVMSQPSSPRRARRIVWTVLAWCGAAAYPVVLYVAMLDRTHGAPPVEFIPVVLLTVLVAALLRRRPLPALAVLLVAWFGAVMATWQTGSAIVIVQVLVTDLAVGYIATTRRRRTSIIAAVMALLVQLGSVVTFPTETDVLTLAVFIVLAMGVTWPTGDSIRERREHAEARRARATVEAVQAERLRIARELHDMVAHSIGVIAIQAGVGGRVIETQPMEARNALTAIETTSRETLSGLRRMLGALRQAEPDRTGAPLDPTPGLAELDRLVATTADAGIRVDVRWRGKRRPLPPDIDLSAFRIVQEAVTNVVRHADTPDCRVALDHRDDELLIEIDDDGRGGDVGTGYGIPGMRERAGLLHGDFTAGPRPDGGFRVTARLPLPEGGR